MMPVLRVCAFAACNANCKSCFGSATSCTLCASNHFVNTATKVCTQCTPGNCASNQYVYQACGAYNDLQCARMCVCMCVCVRVCVCNHCERMCVLICRSSLDCL